MEEWNVPGEEKSPAGKGKKRNKSKKKTLRETGTRIHPNTRVYIHCVQSALHTLRVCQCYLVSRKRFAAGRQHPLSIKRGGRGNPSNDVFSIIRADLPGIVCLFSVIKGHTGSADTFRLP